MINIDKMTTIDSIPAFDATTYSSIEDLNKDRLMAVSSFFKANFSDHWTESGSQDGAINPTGLPWSEESCPGAYELLMKFIHTGERPKKDQITPEQAGALLGALSYYGVENDEVIESIAGYERDECNYWTRNIPGKYVVKKDDNGKDLLDGDGKEIYEADLDKEGNVKLDEGGKEVRKHETERILMASLNFDDALFSCIVKNLDEQDKDGNSLFYAEDIERGLASYHPESLFHKTLIAIQEKLKIGE